MRNLRLGLYSVGTSAGSLLKSRRVAKSSGGSGRKNTARGRLYTSDALRICDMLGLSSPDSQAAISSGGRPILRAASSSVKPADSRAHFATSGVMFTSRKRVISDPHGFILFSALPMGTIPWPGGLYSDLNTSHASSQRPEGIPVQLSASSDVDLLDLELA